MEPLGGAVMFVSLDKDSSLSLTKQLYTRIKTAILDGALNPKEKLPSTRTLSKELSISRNIVIEVYDQLIAEGYLYSIEGSGTYVGEGLHYKKLNINYTDRNRQPDLLYPSSMECISFRAGVPDLNSIPITKWGKLYKEVTLNVLPSQLDYQNSFGMYELRLELAKYLQRVRGVLTTPDHILITSGAAQAFNLLKCIMNKDEFVLVENPSSKGLKETLYANQIAIQTIEMDSNGIETDKLPKMPPKLIFTTPSHQFPTGVILPIKRRLALIRYALAKDAYIVEDDYDSEFRFEGNPIQSMQSIEPSRVIYIGTFSKTLSPAIRMGYMVIPDALIDKIKSAKYIADIHSPILEQLTMSAFIREGYYEKHIQKLKKLYATKRKKLIQLLTHYFQEDIIISGANAGLHLICTFKKISFNEQLLQLMQEQNLSITPLSSFFTKDQSSDNDCSTHSLIMGYGNTSVKEIEIGIQKLYTLLNIVSNNHQNQP